MNHMTRTSVFLGVAAVSIGLAVLTGLASRPGENIGSHELGTPFFPEFDDPLKATALQVAAFDEDSSSVAAFKVEQRNGIWRIPSHHNYPADGEERLAKTATSMLGVERDALVSTLPADHKRYSVLDPLDDELSGTEGYGDRITLYEDDNKLLDLIVGDPVEGQTDVYYVRRPDENQIYRAKLGTVDLSTKFADWIEQDLLQINSSDLVEMMIDPYHIDEVQGMKIQDEEPILLERKPATSSWKLAGIDASTEKEKVSVINAMSRALADLEITGVRPKPQSLVALFRGEGDVQLTTSEMRQMQSAGFFVLRSGDFLANEGEVQAGTQGGVRYRLQFGEVFTGSDVEIEVGSTEATGEETGDDPAENETEDVDELDLSDPTQQRSRFLFVSVVFDESLLGDRPEPPVAPTPPGEEAPAEASEENPETPAGDSPAEAADDGESGAEGDPAAADDTNAENSDADAADQDDGGSDAAASDETAPDADDGDDTPEDAPTPQEIYEQELAAYEIGQEQYEQDLADYEEKVEAGNKRADELNRRFADWYYVISADLYEDLKVSRSDLVEPAEPEAPDTATDGPDPGSLLQGLPQGDTPADAADGAAAPADESTPGDTPESSAPASSEGDSAESDSTPESPEAGDSPEAASNESASPESEESSEESPDATEDESP